MLSKKWTRTCSGRISENILPRPKLFKHKGGEDEFFHEVAKFLLEVGFVSPRFYCMPKKRVDFIIATYEGEIFDWGLLSTEALWEQLYGVQKGKPMKPIFARWLSVLFPTLRLKNRQEEQRPPRPQPASRPRRQVQREEWQEAESTQVDITQLEPEQQQLVPSPIPESTQNPQPDSVPVPQPPQPNQESAPVEPDQPMQQQRQVKERAQRFP